MGEIGAELKCAGVATIDIWPLVWPNITIITITVRHSGSMTPQQHPSEN